MSPIINYILCVATVFLPTIASATQLPKVDSLPKVFSKWNYLLPVNCKSSRVRRYVYKVFVPQKFMDYTSRQEEFFCSRSNHLVEFTLISLTYIFLWIMTFSVTLWIYDNKQYLTLSMFWTDLNLYIYKLVDPTTLSQLQ